MFQGARFKSFFAAFLIAGVLSACALRGDGPEEPEIPKHGSWMEKHQELLRPLPFSEVVLLGSHDSASYGVRKGSPAASGYLTHTGHHLTRHASSRDVGSAVCQDVDIMKQLESGVRHLDLRIAWQDGQYWGMHMWLSVPAFGPEGVFTQVREFNRKHPQEIIVLRMEEVFSETGPMTPSEAGALYSLVENELQGLLVKRQNLFKTTYADLWAGQGRIILLVRERTLENPDADPLLWPLEPLIASPWMDQSDADDLISRLDETIAGWRARPDGKLHCLQAMTTTKKKIFEARDSVNPAVKKLLETDWKDAPFNIVQVDDAAHSGALQPLLDRMKRASERLNAR